jgi:hypothetical protein
MMLAWSASCAMEIDHFLAARNRSFSKPFFGAFAGPHEQFGPVVRAHPLKALLRLH